MRQQGLKLVFLGVKLALLFKRVDGFKIGGEAVEPSSLWIEVQRCLKYSPTPAMRARRLFPLH